MPSVPKGLNKFSKKSKEVKRSGKISVAANPLFSVYNSLSAKNNSPIGKPSKKGRKKRTLDGLS